MNNVDFKIKNRYIQTFAYEKIHLKNTEKSIECLIIIIFIIIKSPS